MHAVLLSLVLFALLQGQATVPALPAAPSPPPARQTPPLTDEIALKDRIQPKELAAALQKDAGPLVLSVGPRTFFEQAHILGAEFAGAASTDAGLKALRERMTNVGKDRWIVVYCGCCPWDRCPNIRPAFNTLHSMGFTHVQALELPQNFGTDWVSKGYPTEQ